MDSSLRSEWQEKGRMAGKRPNGRKKAEWQEKGSMTMKNAEGKDKSKDRMAGAGRLF
jgi:hypothetical protein